MKPLHMGLLVVGAALAGGLAMRLAEPPPVPARPAITKPAPSAARTAAPHPLTATPAVSAPPPKIATAPAPPVLSPPKPEVAPAPPPIYSEPPHVPAERSESPKRQPFGNPMIASANRAPAPEPAHTSPIPPVDYKPQIVASKALAGMPPPEPPQSESPHVVVPARQVAFEAGSPITVRLVETLSTADASAGRIFQATLADPLVCNGLIVAERGARVTGKIADARQAGRFSGVSFLELRLLDFTTADGQRVAISSEPWFKRGDSMGRGSAAKIGGGAALGAVIGAIAGGGLGAAIGAGAGGGAGAGAQAITGGKSVTIPSETVIQFRLASPVKITERQL